MYLSFDGDLLGDFLYKSKQKLDYSFEYSFFLTVSIKINFNSF